MPIRPKILSCWRQYPQSPLLIVLCLITGVIYWPGLKGGFLFDDYPNIVQNPAITISNLDFTTLYRAATEGYSASFSHRPLSLLSFALNYYYHGITPYYFKLVNLILHLTNGIGLYILTRLILQQATALNRLVLSPRQIQNISLLTSAAWLLHPLNLTVVLYSVQRMTGLAAFFTIIGLISYLYSRQQLLATPKIPLARRWFYQGLLIFNLLVWTILAVLSKENGLLLPVFALVIELFLYFKTSSHENSRFLQRVFILFVGLPITLLIIYFATHPHSITNKYLHYDFSLQERILTQPRVLWFYLKLALLPDLNEFALFHDDFAYSTGLLSPWTTSLAIAGITILLMIAFFSINHAPILFFSILFFFAGHSIESTLYPLGMIYEHRNYLPLYGILFGVSYYLIHARFLPATPLLKYGLAGSLLLPLGIITTIRAQDWSSPQILTITELQHHPDSQGARYEAARMYITVGQAQGHPDTKAYYLEKAQQQFEAINQFSPQHTAGLFGLIYLNILQEKPIPADWLTTLNARIAQHNISQHLLSQILELQRCYQQPHCPLALEERQQLLITALNKPQLIAETRASLSYALALSLLQQNQIEAASAYLLQAVLLQPQQAQYRLSYIEILRHQQQFTAARQQLAQILTLKLTQSEKNQYQHVKQQLAQQLETEKN